MDVIVKGNHELVLSPVSFKPMCRTCNVEFNNADEMEQHLTGTGQPEREAYERAMKGII